MQPRAGLPSTGLLDRSGIWPGLLLILLLALAARQLAALPGLPLSPVLLAILFGLALRNLAALPGFLDEGVRFALNRVLKLGIILMGLRLSLAAIGELGLESIPVVVGCIATALLVVNVAARRLGLAPSLAALIAVGTSICGCTAILATAPAIRASRNEICYAVTCVALFGTAGMLVYPWLAQSLFPDDAAAAGMFLGVGIHDTAQVVGAGMLYAEQTGAAAGLDAALVTKLLRNLSIVVVVPALAYIFARQARRAGDAGPAGASVLPLFVLGFVAMSLLRTVGDLGPQPFGLLDLGTWQAFLASAEQGAGLLLTVAMVAVGLSTDLRGLRRLGWQPAAAGLLAALVVGGMGVVLISLLV